MLQDLIKFLEDSPTAFHAVASLEKTFVSHGFKQIDEGRPWQLEPQKKYLVKRNGSTLCAFVTPSLLPKRIRLVASHTDSPCFKLKPYPEIRKNGALLFGVEVYGSPLLSSWFNRDLGLGEFSF